ncbi:MAG: SUMF1/EgtB/PvdO family nonheme iron enzyme [Planctomycetes bacterium]|nr:SUMF1/EgtB/PvdO family nonheme iron enzyme [Planctomycetota bacterium]
MPERAPVSCGQCGQPLPDAARVCPRCGTPVPAAQRIRAGGSPTLPPTAIVPAPSSGDAADIVPPSPPVASGAGARGGAAKRILAGKYEVLGLLGAGSFGAVYRVRHLVLNCEQALKLLNVALFFKPEFRARFKREAELLLKLHHPAIVAVRDVGEWEDSLYMVMDLCPGRTLECALAERGRIPARTAGRLAVHVLRALEHAHEAGIVHRDLKPANLMVACEDTDAWEIRVLDFGLAKVLRRPGAANPGLTSLTQRGAVLGSFGYMSPEQAGGKQIDERTDLYALGVVLYEMLTGRRPFEAEEIAALLEQIRTQPPPPFSELGVSCDVRGVEAVVRRALAKRREDRPASAREMREELEALLSGQGVAVPPESVPGPAGLSCAPDRVGAGTAEPAQPVVRTPSPSDLSYLGKNPQGCDEFRHEPSGLTLILVPAGEFSMGSDDGDSDEKPPHRVVLDEYLIAKHPVTNGQYQAFTRATGRTPPAQPADGLLYPNYFADERYANYPVVNVSWNDAQAFCAWAGLRLPTEAEWERAARGVDGRKYAWGNAEPADTLCRFAGRRPGTEDEFTSPVDRHPAGASPVGALDLAGNVWSWCADAYGRDTYATCRDGERNPTGPDAGSARVVRGGSWRNPSWSLRASNRYRYSPGRGFSTVGVRAARSR